MLHVDRIKERSSQQYEAVNSGNDAAMFPVASLRMGMKMGTRRGIGGRGGSGGMWVGGLVGGRATVLNVKN